MIMSMSNSYWHDNPPLCFVHDVQSRYNFILLVVFFFNKKEVAPLGSVLISDWRKKKTNKTMAAVLIRENRHFYSFFNVIIKFCFQISIRATMSGSSLAPNENSMWLSVPGSFRPRANGSRSLTTTAK